jgi:CubicO group peptidase (beta-lactamase class C family)
MMARTLRAGTAAEAGMSVDRLALIRRRADEWVDQGIAQTLVLLAARRGIVVLHEARGQLTPEPDGPPAQLDTLFPLASMSKPITATALMMLVEDGLVGLNRPVQEYIPEFAGEGKEAVMVHHLLTHTSGIPGEDLEIDDEERRQTVVIPPREDNQHPVIHENLHLGYGAPLWKKPGEEMSYSGYGYRLLGEIVRRVSGKHIGDFARERIFQPLGMRDTHHVVPHEVRHRIVKRGQDSPSPLLDSPDGLDIPSATGGPNVSTAMDMAIFGQTFLNGGAYGEARILSAASVRQMTRNQIPGVSAAFFGEHFPEAGWGYGWEVKGEKKATRDGSLDSPARFGHGGAGGVFLWVDPTCDLVGAYFSVVRAETEAGSPIWAADLFANMVTAAVVHP